MRNTTPPFQQPEYQLYPTDHDHLTPGAAHHRLRKPVFSRWKAEFLKRAPEIFATEPSRGDEQERIVELERMVGRLTMELEAAKKSSDILTSHLSGNGR